jgi:trehalose 6-phosphate synthase/phosphatase
MRLIIVSNRLPIKLEEINGDIKFTQTSGGLATGLASLNLDIERHWIGWPGIFPENEESVGNIKRLLQKDNIHPVFIEPELFQNYYEGYSNSTLWPLCHYFFVYIQFQRNYWNSYQEVNQLFLKAVLEIAEKDDLIWVQDYQLMLLPNMLRQALPESAIGYFHHIPFPSYELFRIIPERKDILNGLLGADLIGFHTYDYMRHFDDSVYRILGHDCKFNQITVLNRQANIDVFPMGINFEYFNNSSEFREVNGIIENYTELFKDKKIILSVDRLDYSKGIINRLKGYSLFLEKYPQYREKVSLVIILVPSRDTVERYNDLKIKIDETIGTINGNYSQMNWIPIHYFYKNLPFNELVALYNIADVAMVTPLRDGMNLVAKEFVATKRGKPGVLILSEMAGAAIELVDSILINPNNICEIENALFEALEMPEAEQLERLEKMQHIIKLQSVQKWATDFIGNLIKVKGRNDEIRKKILKQDDYEAIKQAFNKSRQRLLLLDYDGTLVPYANDPKKTIPGNSLKKLLLQLAQKPNTDVVIISGRDFRTLENWLGDLPVHLVAEHGAYFKDEKIWVKNFTINDNWKDEILQLMQEITDKTPGSMIEIKDSALVWHYRKSDIWLADLHATQLVELLIYPCTRQNLQIMKGSKIVEVKVPGVSKGHSTTNLIKKKNYDFILCAGDDTTDEDMFKELPAQGISIKIGQQSDNARFNLPDTKSFLALLAELNQN